MVTVHQSTTSAAARRRQRVDAALSGAESADVTSATLTALGRIVSRESRRLPAALTAESCDDVTQRVAVRILSSQDGALTLAALNSASAAARNAARRQCERAARSIVGTIVRDATIAADVTTGPLAYRGPVESERVTAALRAAGSDDVRIDRDHQRSYALGAAAAAGYRAGKSAARRAGKSAAATLALADACADAAAGNAASGDWRRIREETTASAVRIVRVQSLDAMLTATLRAPLPTTGNGAESAGRTLAGILADRADTAAPFSAAFSAALTAAALAGSGRGAVALRTATLALADRTAADWSGAARAALDAAALADAAASSARTAAAAAGSTALEHPGRANQTAARAARTAAAGAAGRADAARTLAQVTTSLALSAARRPVTLADVVTSCLTATPDGAARQGTSGQRRRRQASGQSRDVSTLDTATALAVLTGSADTTSNAARALRTALDDAASAALDAASVTPAPSAALARQRARASQQDAAGGRRIPVTWSPATAARAVTLARATDHQRRRDAAAARNAAHVTAALRSALAVWQPVLA